MHYHRVPIRSSLIAAAVLLSLCPLEVAAESAKVWSFKPEKGFIDDPMAFDATDSQFAYIHTDSATYLKVVVMDVKGLKKVKEMEVKNPAIVPKRLVFNEDGKRLLLIWMDGDKGTYSVMVFDVAKGTLLKKKYGPVAHAEVLPVKGQQALCLTTIKKDRKGNKRHATVAYSTATGKRIAGYRIAVQPDGTLSAPNVRILYWEPGHMSLVGMRKGKYDKKRDIRLPDTAIRYDFLERKETWSSAPQKLMKWTLATNLRPQHKGQFRYVHVSDDYKTLYAVSRNNDVSEVSTPVKWGLYEARSLKQQESQDGAQLFFSMTVDPVNPDAVKRKKSDPERVDIYRLDKGSKPTPLGQVLTGRKRGSTIAVRFAWTLAKDHFSYLRKLKGFGRGGKEISIYKRDK